MAERAVLVSERPDGRWAVTTSRWGGTDQALAAVCTGTAPTALPSVSWSSVRTTPDFPAAVATLDFLSREVVYRVSDGVTTVFLPLWFGLPLASTVADPDAGALVAVRSLADARALRRQFRSLKGRLADAVRDGEGPAPAAPYGLAAAVAQLTDRERYLVLAPGAAERLSPGTGPTDL